jgi:hypothetical protein
MKNMALPRKVFITLILIIVKKIPFAFFINIGYAIFMIIGGYKLWLGT